MSGNGNGNGERAGRTLSRIGRKPIPIPQGVEVDIKYGEVTVKGPMGTMTQTYHPEVKVAVEDGAVVVERLSDRKFHHSLHGLTRSLISNAVVGVNGGLHPDPRPDGRWLSCAAGRIRESCSTWGIPTRWRYSPPRT